MKELNIEKLHIAVGDQEIVRGLTLRVPRGEVHALMGPNGSGKSTLAKVLAGHPDYHVTAGKILMDGEDLLELEPDERARRGLFLAFQYPSEIPGVTIANFLRAALQSRLPEGEELEATDYYAKLYEKMELLGMDRSFTSRAVNEGFSGGEKKRTEILQMAVLEPQYAVLDETDSGLDIDALKTVAHGVNSLRGPDLGILLITHYQRLLNYIIPDYVHVMVAGRMVRSGRKELALELDAGTGLSERTVHYISDVKEDPDWVREYRLRSMKTFLEKPLPTHWASKDLEAIDFDKIRYYLS